MAESAEFRTLRENIVAIRACISEPDLLKFAGELFQDGLVSDAGHDTAIAVTGTPPGTVVARLVSEAMNKAGNSPDHFYKFVCILESRNKALASTLKSAYSELHGGIVSQRVQQTDGTQSIVLSYRPGKPQSMDVSHDQIKLKWSQPEQGAAHDTNLYVIAYRSVTDPESKWLLSTSQHSNSATIVGLSPNTKYVFKVRADTVDAGSSLYSDLSDPIQTMLPPPGRPCVTNVSFTSCKSIHIAWEKPQCDGIQYYCISYQSDGDPADKWSTVMTDSNENSYKFGGNFCKQYVFKVSAVTAAGPSSESEVSEPIKTLVKPRNARLLSSCKLISPRTNQITRIYQLPLHYTMKTKCIHKAYVGDHLVRSTIAERVPHKVLMLVGATGAGKSTLINAMANYIMGVDWEDEYRFKLISEKTEHDQTKSQTKCITAYTFYKDDNSFLPYTLTVIDTPGIGGTGGLERDKEIIKTIKELFSIRCDEGIDQLHGIGFVTQAPLARLTPTQRYVFDSILSLFGKNVADNIFLMATFADGERPPVLDAARAAGVPFNDSYFKFNNFALYSNQKDEFDVMFWKMGKKSFSDFFDHFSKAKCQSLQQSREVLQEREHLEVTIQGLQPQIRAGLAKIDELRQERHLLNDHEADIVTNRDFTYQVQITKQRKIDLPVGRYTTNCLKCNYTCHDNCIYANDGDKFKCSAMKNQGKQDATCRVCHGQCSWRDHVCNPYRFEIYQETETRTSDELKAKYESAMSDKGQVEVVMTKMKQDLKDMDQAVLSKIRQAKRCLQRLQEIALKPDPLTELEYIDILIESEKQEARPGWYERVKALHEVRKQAEIVTDIWSTCQTQDISLKSVQNQPEQQQHRLWTRLKSLWWENY